MERDAMLVLGVGHMNLHPRSVEGLTLDCVEKCKEAHLGPANNAT